MSFKVVSLSNHTLSSKVLDKPELRVPLVRSLESVLFNTLVLVLKLVKRLESLSLSFTLIFFNFKVLESVSKFI